MSTTQKNSRIPVIPAGKLELMINAATIDCENESEQQTGWFTMIEQNLAVPFETTILGVPVTVAGIDIDERSVTGGRFGDEGPPEPLAVVGLRPAEPTRPRVPGSGNKIDEITYDTAGRNHVRTPCVPNRTACGPYT